MMFRNLVGGLALVLASSFTVAVAGASGRSLPMHFEWQEEGPTAVCGAQCRTWVSAIGTITSETPHEFAEFAREHDLRGATLVLNSGGGSVHGAMALGRQIRQLGMTTTVGRMIKVPARSKSDKAYAKLSPLADCESMCAFVLLSGVKRIVPQGARLLVHQIWLGDRRDDAAAATYSAEDLVLVQRDIGRLAQYTIEMGGSIDFLELSLRIPPWEPMRAINRDEMLRMHVEAGPQPAPTLAAAATAASSPALTSGGRRGSEGATRGWVVTEHAGRPVLVRSHPLTVEGDEIGSFDLMLACGETPESITVAYREQRVSSGQAGVPLKAVALSLGAQSEPLSVVSSELMPRSLELKTHAQASVSVSLIRSFSELRNRALIISTENAKETRTVIRVGNSGFGRAFAELQRSCGGHHLHAANSPRTGQSNAR